MSSKRKMDVSPATSSRLPNVVHLFLAVQAALLGWTAWRQTPVTMEVYELAAGIYHLQSGRFNVAVVNPPLVRCIAALPLLGDSTPFYTLNNEFVPANRSERRLGRSFLSLSGRDSYWKFTVARWFCIPFAILGGYVCACWAFDLYGRHSSVIAAFCWATSPWILGHGGLVTTDVPAAAMSIWSAYLFQRSLLRTSLDNTLAAGTVMGLALLTKFTLIILPGICFVWWLLTQPKRPLASWRSTIAHLTMFGLVTLLVINMGYGFEGSFRQLKHFSFTSTLMCGDTRHERQTYGNRFTGGPLQSITVPLPENYVIGIDVQRKDFERGLESYAAGFWKNHGWWWYYLYAIAVKNPVSMLCMSIWAMFYCFSRKIKTDELPTLALLMCFLIFVSLQTGFSVHARYIIPCFPFLFVFTSSLLQDQSTFAAARAVRMTILCVAMALETAMCYPHCISFFNILAGGPSCGYRHLVDSNLAWGQDAIYLSDWLQCHPEITNLRLLFFGNASPSIAGVRFQVPTEDDIVIDKFTGDAKLAPGWYAVDVNYLAGSIAPCIDERGTHDFMAPRLFPWATLSDQQPVGRVGYSIVIYRVISTGEEVDSTGWFSSP